VPLTLTRHFGCATVKARGAYPDRRRAAVRSVPAGDRSGYRDASCGCLASQEPGSPIPRVGCRVAVDSLMEAARGANARTANAPTVTGKRTADCRCACVSKAATGQPGHRPGVHDTTRTARDAPQEGNGRSTIAPSLSVLRARHEADCGRLSARKLELALLLVPRSKERPRRRDFSVKADVAPPSAHRCRRAQVFKTCAARTLPADGAVADLMPTPAPPQGTSMSASLMLRVCPHFTELRQLRLRPRGLGR